MKHLKTFESFNKPDFNAESDFSSDVGNTQYLIKETLDILKIEYSGKMWKNTDEYLSPATNVYSWIIENGDESIIIDLYNTNFDFSDTQKSDDLIKGSYVYVSDMKVSHESILNIKELIQYLKNKKLLDTSKWTKQLNELRSEDDILKDPGTDYKEKQRELNDLNSDKIDEYKSKKINIENIFDDLENDVDPPTVSKLISDNQYLKQYTMLLAELRDKKILQTQIESQEVELEDTKKSMVEADGESKSVLDNIEVELEKKISNNKSIVNKLDIENQIIKFDEHMVDLERDLDNGQSALKSTISDLKL